MSTTSAPVSRQHRRRFRRWAVAALLALASTMVLDAPAAAVPASPPRSAESAPDLPWAWPVDGARKVIAPFRAPAHDYGPGHRGMDIAVASGATVRAPASGTVAFRGVVVDRPLITIDHGAGYVTTLEPVSSVLSPGHPVSAGDVLGNVESGGHAVAGTMHVGVRIDGDYVNPRGLFGDIPRAVLLPCCGG